MKVKWSRYRPGVAQRMGRGIALLFHDRGTRRGSVVSVTAPAALYPGERPGTNCTEGWVGPRAGLDGRKISPHRDSIQDRPARSSVAIPTELPGPPLRRIYGQICEGGQWRKRYNRESEELYSEPNRVTVIKSIRLRWIGHAVRMVDNELPKNILWTNRGGQRGRGRPNSRWIDRVEEYARKLAGRRMPRTVVAGDICWRRPRPT